MPFLFGKAITYTFYPVQEKDYVSLTGVTDNPAIYVYKDTGKPMRAEAAAGTDNGHLVGVAITSWSATADGNGKSFTIPAITDPEPDGATETRTYWLAINFKLVNSGSTQTIIRALPLQRVSAHHKAISTAAADLEAIYPTIDDHASSTAQTAAITTATTAAKLYLEALGFDWAEIWRPDFLSTAISYKALSLLMLAEIADTGDKWELLAKTYEGIYKGLIDGLKLEYIAQPANAPDDDDPVPVRTYFLRAIR